MQKGASRSRLAYKPDLAQKEEKSLKPLAAFYGDGGGYSVTRVFTKALLFLIGPEMLRPNV